MPSIGLAYLPTWMVDYGKYMYIQHTTWIQWVMHVKVNITYMDDSWVIYQIVAPLQPANLYF